MSPRRVIVHYMHETERDAAKQLMPNGVVTDAMVVGTIDDADAQRLQQQGIVVQYLDQPQPARRRRLPTRPGVLSATRATAPGALPPSPPPGAEIQYRVQLAGPLINQWRQRLEQTGASIREATRDYALRVVMKPSSVAAVQALTDFVLQVDPWTTESESDEADVMATVPPKGAAVAMLAFDVLLLQEAFRPAVLAWLADRRVPVAGAAGDKIRFYAPEDSTVASDLQGRRDWIAQVEPFVAPELHNDRARAILGVDAIQAAGGVPLQGAGQIVGVADTGVDDQHNDLRNRLRSTIPLGRPNDSTDPHGHGTHVAGSIVGEGVQSNGQIRGVAPGAQLVFQSLLDSSGKLGGLPFRLQGLFDEAYQLGVRIHNNSWGSATKSSYRVNSREVDDFVYQHKDMLIVISAGNEGTAADPPIGVRSAGRGFVDWLTVGSPATAKNALTVGASRSDRTSGGYSQLTYGAAWPNEFCDAPIRDATISADPESMSGFSSRGPCDSYRIKPDVVAPGTDILSCRSRRAPLRNFWGPYPPSADYAYMGGTSMAAPLVAGCAALVREYFVTRRNHQPSAALLKATLINGARWLTGADSTADHATQPNYHQGFGRVDLPSSMPDLLDPAQRLEFIDNWNDPSTQLASDQRRRWVFDVQPGGAELRLCLVHTDPPGNGLQNNLNLLLEMPGGAKRFGNMQLPMGLNQPDAVNNVEVLRISNPPPGPYLLQVTATSVLQGPQDYALVVSGPLSSSLNPA